MNKYTINRYILNFSKDLKLWKSCSYMTKNILFTIFIFFNVIIKNYTFSQSFNDTITIEEINIIETKKELYASLTKKEIDTNILSYNYHKKLSDLLTSHSNIHIRNYGYGLLSTASFRGTAASHTQIVWNGININSQSSGQMDLSLIPIFLVDNINIYYSGTSLFNTNGALGGSIVLENKPKFYTSTKKEISIIFNHQQIGNLLNLFYSKKKFFFTTKFYSNFNSNKYRYYNNTISKPRWEQQKNAQQQAVGLWQEIFFRKNANNLFSIKIWLQSVSKNIPPIMTFSGYRRVEYQTDKISRFILEYQRDKKYYTLKYNTAIALTNLIYVLGDYIKTNENDSFYVAKANSLSYEKAIYNNLDFRYKRNSKYEYHSTLSSNYFNVSILNKIKTDGQIYNCSRKELILKNYLIYNIISKLTGYTAMNIQVIDYKLIPLTYIFGLSFKPLLDKKIFLKTNFAKNYHLPTLNDLYWTPGGNADLIPECGYSGEMNLSYNLKYENIDIDLNSTIYANLIDNWISWQPSEFKYWTAKNIKKVFARGTDFSFQIQDDSNILKYTIAANYAYTRTADVSDKTNLFSQQNLQLIYIPLHNANLFVQILIKKYTLSYSYNFTSKCNTSYNTDNYRYTLPAYGLHNLTIGKNFKTQKNKDLEIKVEINNILNKQYQVVLYRAMPGTAFLFSISIK